MASTIKISPSQRLALQNHAQKHSPNESCAILYGKIEEKSAIVEDMFLADNTDDSPVNFTISNEQLIEAYERAEENGTRVIGIFHSHPSSEARPSDTDKRFMEINPVVWVIYSGNDSSFRAFVLDEHVKEIGISV